MHLPNSAAGHHLGFFVFAFVMLRIAITVGAGRRTVVLGAAATLRASRMDETTISREAMGRLAKALAFICGADNPTTVALKTAAESGAERDIKNARTLFLRLKQSERRAALAMLND